MNIYVALLRAVNVGGTGKLPISDLKALCVEAEFSDVRTYIASGNVVFRTKLSATEAKAALETKLADYAGKPVGATVRTAPEMIAILAANPFSHAAPNRNVVIFLDEAPHADALREVSGRKNEAVALGMREIYVHYGDGMADSKLKIPAAKNGTARNMNTLKKLVEMLNQ